MGGNRQVDRHAPLFFWGAVVCIEKFVSLRQRAAPDVAFAKGGLAGIRDLDPFRVGRGVYLILMLIFSETSGGLNG